MTNINTETCQSLLEWMRDNARNIVILTHANPDGDALGSSLGLNEVLLNAGFNSAVVFPTDFPPIVPELNEFKNWIIFEQREKLAIQQLNDADLVFLLDFNDIKRVGRISKVIESMKDKFVLIDHHPDPMIETRFLFSDTRVSSTAELVYDFVIKMDWEKFLDVRSAEAILTGIIADTASFSHNAHRSELYAAVAGLIGHGANQAKIQEALFNTNSEGRLRLLGYALSEKMEIFPQYHAAIIALTRAELKKYNFKIGDTEGFVNYPLSIKGIIFSAFFMENEDKIKISFRSKGGFPVNEFSSRHFSGGGHHNAAGGESRETLAVAVEKLKELFPLYARSLEEEYLKDA